jgi:HEAT repeat protein
VRVFFVARIVLARVGGLMMGDFEKSRSFAFVVGLACASLTGIAARAVPDAASSATVDVRAPDMKTRRAALKILSADGSARAVDDMVQGANAAAARNDSVGVRDIAHALKQVKNPDAVGALLALVESEQKSKAPIGLLGAAIETLGDLRDPKAAPVLRAILDDSTRSKEHRAAFFALAKTTNAPDDVARYATALKDRKTASDAARAIGEMENPALASALVPLLTDPDVNKVDLAKVIRALGRMADPKTAVPLMDVVERGSESGPSGAAAEALVTCVEPENIPRLLKMMEARRGSRALHAAFVAADRRQGHKALRGLLKSNPTLATELLYTMSSDVHPTDEDIAYAALATSKTPRGGDPLRRAGLEVLGRVNSARAEETLCRELKDKDNTSSIRTDAVAGLARAKSDASITCLIDVLESESKLKTSAPRQFSINVHEDTTRALERIAGERLGPDAKAFRTWHAAGLKAGLDGFLGGLTHKDESVRTLAATRLGALAKKGMKNAEERQKAAHVLSSVVIDERNATARTAMVTALGELRDRSATEALVRVLERAGSKDFDEKVALARALDQLGDARGTASLVEGLGSSDDKTRAESARALSAVTGEPLHHDVNRWRAWWKTYAERYRAR